MDEPITNRITNFVRNLTGTVADPFPREIAGLPEASSTQVVDVPPGSSHRLRAYPIRKRIGDSVVKMLAYGGSIPGPTLRVQQGSEVTVSFTNDLELETTVHWHGLRLDNRFDGVPEGVHHGHQKPLAPGESYEYHLRFPDPGLFWYHPHVREDYTQEHGLYGNIVVVPSDPGYWAPANREVTLVLDDILIEGGKVAQFSQSQSNRTAMGRFGNVMLANGDASWTLEAKRGEVVRLYLTNTANVRTFSFRIQGARMKLVGGDNGRVEREAFVDQIVIAPSERYVVDVLFEKPGSLAVEHVTPKKTYRLGTVEVTEKPVEQSLAGEFGQLRQSAELRAERERIEADFEREPDKTIALVGEMAGMSHHGGHHKEIEWEDDMRMMNRMSTPNNMHWKVVDRETGSVNHDIDWAFRTGDRVKIRIVNEPDSDHPMQHPFHFHGQRFLVLSRDGVRNDNLVWKDTVLCESGQTVDILLDCANPGAWMAHCHIAEHLEAHMMFTYIVGEAGAQTGDEHGEHGGHTEHHSEHRHGQSHAA